MLSLFHSSTYGLLSKGLVRGNESGLEHLEERLGLKLPSSIREWFSFVDGHALLAEYSNDDQSLSHDKWFRKKIDGKDIVFFLIENQGVCWWGFELHVGEDPPVHVNFDPPPDKLFTYSTSFSEFTYVRVFDHIGWCDDSLSSHETYSPVKPSDLDKLRDRFKVEPTSYGWPGLVVYRFSNEKGRIIIWQSEGQSDWSIVGADKHAFIELEKSVSDVCRKYA